MTPKFVDSVGAWHWPCIHLCCCLHICIVLLTSVLCAGSVSDNTIKLLVKLSVMLLSGFSYLSYYHLGLECICWSFILSQKFCYNLRTTFFRSRVRTNAHLGLVWTSVISSFIRLRLCIRIFYIFLCTERGGVGFRRFCIRTVWAHAYSTVHTYVKKASFQSHLPPLHTAYIWTISTTQPPSVRTYYTDGPCANRGWRGVEKYAIF